MPNQSTSNEIKQTAMRHINEIDYLSGQLEGVLDLLIYDGENAAGFNAPHKTIYATLSLAASLFSQIRAHHDNLSDDISALLKTNKGASNEH